MGWWIDVIRRNFCRFWVSGVWFSRVGFWVGDCCLFVFVLFGSLGFIGFVFCCFAVLVLGVVTCGLFIVSA